MLPAPSTSATLGPMEELLAEHQALVLAWFWAIHFVAIATVLLARHREPSATLAWILTIIFLPLIGLFLYLFFGVTRLKRINRSVGSSGAILKDKVDPVASRNLASEIAIDDYRTRAQVALGDALATTPARSGNQVQILHNAARTYRALIEAFNDAKEHIHVEFYIIQGDQTGQALRDRLTQCAARGVEVRVLYDAVGSMGLPRGFWNSLVQAGGKAAAFRPVARHLPFVRSRDRIDFRNHRKNVIVDGKIGFTGGINIGREYLGLDPDVGRWRDTHLEIAGPAATSLQRSFALDWHVATGELLHEAYFPEVSPQGECIVQVVDTGPDHHWPSMELLYAQAINAAASRAWITSPYFVPSKTIQHALITAKLRGVDVRLLLPSRSDSILVGLAGRSYYYDLLQAGIRIYEYQRGFVHAKTMVIDSWLGTVGSANMDIRSFNLNFELNAFVLDETFTRDLAGEFKRDLNNASEITLEMEMNLGTVTKLARSAARLLSPLM